MKVKTILSRLINGTDIELFLQEEELDIYSYNAFNSATREVEDTSKALRSKGEIPTVGAVGDQNPDAFYIAPSNTHRQSAFVFTYQNEFYVVGETGMMTTYSNLVRNNTKEIAGQFDKLFANTGTPTNMYNINTVSDLIKSIVNKDIAYQVQGNHYAYYCNSHKELEAFRFMMDRPQRFITERFADELGAQVDRIVLTEEKLTEMRSNSIRYQHMVKNAELMLVYIKNNFSGQSKNKYMLRLFCDIQRANNDVGYYSRRVFGDSSNMLQYADEASSYSNYEHYTDHRENVLRKYGEKTLGDLFGAQVYFEDVHNSLAAIKKYSIIRDMGMEFKGTVM